MLNTMAMQDTSKLIIVDQAIADKMEQSNIIRVDRAKLKKYMASQGRKTFVDVRDFALEFENSYLTEGLKRSAEKVYLITDKDLAHYGVK